MIGKKVRRGIIKGMTERQEEDRKRGDRDTLRLRKKKSGGLGLSEPENKILRWKHRKQS